MIVSHSADSSCSQASDLVLMMMTEKLWLSDMIVSHKIYEYEVDVQCILYIYQPSFALFGLYCIDFNATHWVAWDSVENLAMQVQKESQLGRSLIELLRTESILSTVRHEIFYLKIDDEDNPLCKLKNECAINNQHDCSKITLQVWRRLLVRFLSYLIRNKLVKQRPTQVLFNMFGANK